MDATLMTYAFFEIKFGSWFMAYSLFRYLVEGTDRCQNTFFIKLKDLSNDLTFDCLIFRALAEVLEFNRT